MLSTMTIPPKTSKTDQIISQHLPTIPSEFKSAGVAPVYRANMTDSQKFGKRLVELRSDREITQMQLAIAAGRDRSFISDLERGMKSPTLDTMRLIADVFMISISELCRGI